MQSQKKTMDGMTFELIFRTDPFELSVDLQIKPKARDDHPTHRLPRDPCVTPLTTTNHQAIGGVLTTSKAAANFIKHSEVAS